MACDEFFFNAYMRLYEFDNEAHFNLRLQNLLLNRSF